MDSKKTAILAIAVLTFIIQYKIQPSKFFGNASPISELKQPMNNGGINTANNEIKPMMMKYALSFKVFLISFSRDSISILLLIIPI